MSLSRVIEIKLKDGSWLHISGEIHISTHGVLTIKGGTSALVAYASGEWLTAESLDAKIIQYKKKRWWKR